MEPVNRRGQFIAAARSMLGARWRHRGRKPWAVDCLGLIILAGESAGMKLNAPRVYGREPWDDSLRKGLREHIGEPLPATQALPGDIALIRWRSGEPSHVAVVGDHPSGWLTLIHAHNVHGVVEHSLAAPFDSVIVEVYRPWPDTFSQ